MGWGDEIIASAQAKRMHLADPRRRVAIRGKDSRARWHPIWDHNPRLAHPGLVDQGADVQWLYNCSGHRPYIDYSKETKQSYTWVDFKVEPGEIYLTEGEKTLSRVTSGAIVIEPHIKPAAPINKHWGRTRWLALIEQLKGRYDLVQLGEPGVETLPGVRRIMTYSIREACGYLAGARAAILPEGGLHHAAAALGVRAVVIFGGYISPAITGYDTHENLFTGGKACGRRVPCGHCGEAMAKISPNQAAEALERILAPAAAQQEVAA